MLIADNEGNIVLIPGDPAYSADTIYVVTAKEISWSGQDFIDDAMMFL